MVKVSNFMYAMILVIGVIAVLFTFIGEITNNYDVDIPEEHNATLVTLSSMSSIQSYVNETKASALSEDADQERNWVDEALDILGLWFERGVKTLKLFPKLLTLFETMVSATLSSSSNLLGVAATPLKFMIISLVTTAIIVGVFVSALLKKDI